MKTIRGITCAIAVTALLLGLQCSPVANNGTGSTTETANVKGFLYTSDGTTPAKGAKVYLVPADHNPRQGLAKALAAAPESTVTNDSGIYRLDSVPAGTYNVLAAGSGNLAFQDSIGVKTDTLTQVPADTLKAPGSLRGLIRLQPGDDARTVFVLFMGTNTWGTPDDSTGKFGVANMAEGTYRVRILTTLDAYVPKDTVFSVTAGKVDTLPHDIVLQYTGIPVVGGLVISYDTLKQVVTLIWNKPMTGRKVAGYSIYRKQQDSTSFVKIKSIIPDTLFADSTLKDSGSYQYRVTAIDTLNTEGVQSTSILVIFKNRLKLAVASAVFGMRRDHSSIAFNGKLWVIGGTNENSQYNNDVWYSPDGIIWSQSTDSAAFPKRKLHASVAFNNKMWVIGGLNNNYGELNDVWNSTDGQTWTRVADTTAFARRYAHGCVVFNGEMWVIGGDSTGGVLLTDVWHSADGIIWNKATNSAGFSPREGFRATVFDNKIWVIGGASGSTYKNDVWYSQDGTAWNQATASAPFSSRNGHSLAVKDSLIWLFCGRGNSGDYNDVWYSGNGINWTHFYGPSNFGTKFGHTSVTLANRIWIIGQVANQSQTDIWYLQ